MKKSYEKYSNEELEKRLNKMEKYQKLLTPLLVFSVIATVIYFIAGTISTVGICLIAISIILKFIIYPKQIGELKMETNKRKGASL